MLLLAVACQTNREKANSNIDEDKNSQIVTDGFANKTFEVNAEFSIYLDNFAKADLPIVVKACWVDTKGLVEFDAEKYKKFNEYHSFSYRQIPTNGNYIATITLGIADCYTPVLTTYKLNGQMIDSKTIAIGYCGTSCGYSCEEFMTISNDFKIYTSDTISSYVCDSFGHEIPGTYEYYVIYKQGELLANGDIQLSDENKKMLEGRKKVSQ